MRKKVGAMLRISLIALTAPLFSFVVAPNAHATFAGPSQPTNIQQSSSLNNITVTWGAPSTPNGTVSGYWVQYSSDTGTTWSTASNSILGSVYSYTISGLNSYTNYYVRVSATNGTWGLWGYSWKKLYSFMADNGSNSGNYILSGTQVVANSSQTWNYVSGYGLSSIPGGGQAANTYANALIGRVMYAETATINSVTTVATQDMKPWAANNIPYWYNSVSNAVDSTAHTSAPTSIENLAIPDLANHPTAIQTNVSDYNSFNSTNSALVESGTVGRLEIWPYNYNYQQSGLTTSGDNTNFDSDDVDVYAADYGSFQIHSQTGAVSGTAATTDFAWNHHFGSPEIGFGNDPNHTTTLSANPSGEGYDWTFCSNTSGHCPTPTSFQLDILIDIPIQTGLAGTVTQSATSSTGSTFQFGKTSTITANVPPYAGTVTFYYNGKQIFHCVNVATTGTTATCTWKPTYHGYAKLTALYTATAGGTVSNITIPYQIMIGSRVAARG
jgi:hypothetical protein